MRSGKFCTKIRFSWASLVLGSMFRLISGESGQTIFERPNTSERLISNSQWDFNEEPSINTTSHLIFNTVSSFLQHWPNTRYRNGHTIVPATVPIGTLLYHGTYRPEIPKIPEWTATDPEHSYLFCIPTPGTPDSGCWHLTLVATRSLKVLYFDGSSAAKMHRGPMDSQDMVLFGEVRREWSERERERIDALCKWGKQYELDGFLRMQMDFEVMLCNFTEGVKPVSMLNLALSDKFQHPRPPGYPPYPKSAHTERHKPRTPLHVSTLFRVVEAASWHRLFPGEPRIQLDYSRLISFYDTEMFPSLQASRFGRSRLDHRLDGISKEDAEVFAIRLDEVLREDKVIGSGVDWRAIIKVVTNRYDERVELLHYILRASAIASDVEANDTLKKAHRHITSMFTPYILHTSVPSEDVNHSANHSWAVPVFELCATTHISYIEEFLLSSAKLTPSERTLLYAVKGVSKEICRVLVGLWAEGVESGLEELDLGTEEPYLQKNMSLSNVPPREMLDQWRLKVEALMAWLDWSYWNRCKPACSYEEMCYLPTWPFFFPLRRWSKSNVPKVPFQNQTLANTSVPLPQPHHPQEKNINFQGNDRDDDEENEDGEWVDPKPRCIRRVEPLQWKDW